jgi:hypothetical protein
MNSQTGAGGCPSDANDAAGLANLAPATGIPNVAGNSAIHAYCAAANARAVDWAILAGIGKGSASTAPTRRRAATPAAP